MLSISIMYDGEKVEISQSTLDAENAIGLLNRWREIAEEPCPAGEKCPILKQFLDELEGVLNG